MTETRASHYPALVLGEGEPETRNSQFPALVLGENAVPSRASQFPILVLGEQVVESRISQAPMMVLCSSTPCVSYLVQAWEIIRKDGVAHRFTAHDRPVIFRGETYIPCGAIEASAYRNSGETGEGGDAELRGLIANVPGEAGIPARDIAAGLLDGGQVRIWELPWDNAGAETAFPVLRGFIGRITSGDVAYKAEVLTLSSLFADPGLLETYSPLCRYELGDSRCGVNLAALTEAGTVTGLAAPSARSLSNRRQFFDSARTEANHYWRNGFLRWTGGANAGYGSEVAESFATGAISLWNAAPNPIEGGDTYTVEPGCDKQRPTCIAKFNNIARFGGFPDLPGNDVILQTPDAKE